MILRRPSSPDSVPVVHESGDYADHVEDGWGRHASLRWRVTILTASMVGVVVGVMTALAYWSVSMTLTNSLDSDLRTKAVSMLARTEDPAFFANVKNEVQYFRDHNQGTRLAIQLPGWTFIAGDDLPLLSTSTEAVQRVDTVNGERVFMASNEKGTKVIVARDMTETQGLILTLGLALLTFGGLGFLLSIATGFIVASAGLKPLARLQEAVDEVTETQELKPIPVLGRDELARLTASFNEMFAALDQSRVRQAQLVADAGHELKTPLTSMRTNIELLMMMQQPGSPVIPESEKKALEFDVLAQMEELSTLIGDLVDLAREDAAERSLEEVDLAEISQTALDRVRRRRPDVEFRLHLQPWFMFGDAHSLGRVMVNLMDNAAKWSPADGVVRVEMKNLNDGHIQITVADSGPGIPPEEREKVFERFYRSIQARSMPGSGLGLAIVRQVVTRHGGEITAEESDDGGALFRVVLPGSPRADELERTNELVVNAHESRPKFSRADMFRNRHKSIGK